MYQYDPLGVTDVRTQSLDTPRSFALGQNYPNPFNPSTMITVRNTTRDHMRLVVYDILGREVAILMDGVQEAGIHDVRFDASGLASGVYIARLSAGTVQLTREMMLVR